jgi:hypothetical protein
MEVLKITGSGRTLQKNRVKAPPTNLQSGPIAGFENY